MTGHGPINVMIAFLFAVSTEAIYSLVQQSQSALAFTWIKILTQTKRTIVAPLAPN